MYEFNGMFLTEENIQHIKNHVEDKLPSGSFFTAIICNDLRGAVGNADCQNIHKIPAYVSYFVNHTPSACWGSREKMEAWLEKDKNA